MDKKPTYAGRISHNGAQSVKAPLPGESRKGNTVVKTGNKDLRSK